MPDESSVEDQLAPGGLRQDTTSEPDHEPEPLTEAQRRTLVRLIRLAYPHPDFPDGPYQRAAEAVQDAVGPLAEGLDQLDAEAGGSFIELGDDEATAVVERIADSDFFGLVHGTVIVALYDDHEMWELLGYEGPSFDKGGYLDRGFDDLDWLPRPRIEEYTAEQRAEVVPPAGGDH
ncbi:hypothetical protein [Microlunatus parietis]|uniref:Gluconate 2-dehydrogenase subunit 3 n=1 Tax=Microlunatus parietis TaxID=682979 RepID=A0A7Y9IA26_9ACTN|nr:hypothetical protein [Microlunatus parietis]NYE72865.1 hypothetical protein [Microlunatus parietis]